ncbi:epoxyqueuosine reductase QueH [Lacrimispora defluvii]|uniref:Epoxyqueuosine reductase QueH n=1 Tax=Lacrimispora defluvii TaxID=2719233 RepID=A0ABX1VW44_9FIRM|nr:epoxyqueuosine reductase QueH [Lacrimispora defluvii]NNJ32319.1 epoxyqueuosine reductase QueH [Lacrimispora defluvii]
MNPRNYQKELDQIIEEIKVQNKVPKLLIHSCCAPCSSYVLEYLSQYFEITVYFYNPNIYPPLEYIRRVEEQDRLIQEMNFVHPVTLQTGAYEPQEFYRIVEGLEKEPEGGLRCFRCYELRLQEAAKIAQAGRFDYFTTTLSISPLKNADKLNEIGEKLGREYRVAYLPSDFKKKNGYKRSVELSKEHDLYRQDYCGCVFSQRERQTKESSC